MHFFIFPKFQRTCGKPADALHWKEITAKVLGFNKEDKNQFKHQGFEAQRQEQEVSKILLRMQVKVQ